MLGLSILACLMDCRVWSDVCLVLRLDFTMERKGLKPKAFDFPLAVALNGQIDMFGGVCLCDLLSLKCVCA